MKNFEKKYLLHYSIKDKGCDTRLRSVVIVARSLSYARNKLTRVLDGMYKKFVIIYQELVCMYDEDDWMSGYGDKIGAYQRV